MTASSQACPHRDLREAWRDWCAGLDRLLEATSPYSARRGRWRGRLSVAFAPSLLALLGHRLAHAAGCVGLGWLAALLSAFNRWMWRVDFTPRSCLGGGTFLPHPVGVSFDADAGPALTLYSQVVCGPNDASGRPRLGRGVTLGVHSVVMGAVGVGDGATIGFRGVLTKNLDAGAVLVSGRRPKISLPGSPDHLSEETAP